MSLHYQHRQWFYDKMHLLHHVEFSYWPCSHDTMPESEEDKEGFDEFFLTESTLEALGWLSISVSCLSPRENIRIRRWSRQFGTDIHVRPRDLCDDHFAFIGPAEHHCMCLTMKPELFDTCMEYLARMQARPCLAIFEGVSEFPQEVDDILEGKNVLRLDGQLGIVLSFEMVLDADYRRIVAIADEVSKPNRPQPQKWTTTTTTTTSSTAYVSVNYVAAA